MFLLLHLASALAIIYRANIELPIITFIIIILHSIETKRTTGKIVKDIICLVSYWNGHRPKYGKYGHNYWNALVYKKVFQILVSPITTL